MGTGESPRRSPRDLPSQTLHRGIRVLETLASSGKPMTVGDISTRLGLHRSIVYRILRTLDGHRLVTRLDDGRYTVGVGLVVLARPVFGDVQSAATGELSALADEVGATAFLTVPDGDDCVTVASVEPRRTIAHVSYKPGLRHPLTRGAPGLAMLAAWPARPGERPDVTEARRRGWARSTSEVVQGLSAIAAPVHAGGEVVGAVAVVFVAGDLDEPAVAQQVMSIAKSVGDAVP